MVREKNTPEAFSSSSKPLISSRIKKTIYSTVGLGVLVVAGCYGYHYFNSPDKQRESIQKQVSSTHSVSIPQPNSSTKPNATPYSTPAPLPTPASNSPTSKSKSLETLTNKTTSTTELELGNENLIPDNFEFELTKIIGPENYIEQFFEPNQRVIIHNKDLQSLNFYLTQINMFEVSALSHNVEYHGDKLFLIRLIQDNDGNLHLSYNPTKQNIEMSLNRTFKIEKSRLEEALKNHTKLTSKDFKYDQPVKGIENSQGKYFSFENAAIEYHDFKNPSMKRVLGVLSVDSLVPLQFVYPANTDETKVRHYYDRKDNEGTYHGHLAISGPLYGLFPQPQIIEVTPTPTPTPRPTPKPTATPTPVQTADPRSVLIPQHNKNSPGVNLENF